MRGKVSKPLRRNSRRRRSTSVSTTAIPLASASSLASTSTHSTTPTAAQLTKVIEQQFDIEILLKHQELAIIESRMAEIGNAMKRIEKFHEPKQDLFCIRSDGAKVRLQCIVCKASKFENTQSFLEHCCLKHNLSYKTLAYATWQCGIPVDSYDNDLSCKTPHLAALLSQKNSKINIKELVEDVCAYPQDSEDDHSGTVTPPPSRIEDNPHLGKLPRTTPTSSSTRNNTAMEDKQRGLIASLSRYISLGRFF